jgi:hypothetical protein
VTTSDAAAARRQSFSLALAVAIGLAGFGLAGCGGSLFGTASSTPQDTAPPASKTVAEAPVAKVAINSIVGPPDPLGKQLQQEFATALGQQRIAVTAGRDERADYHLRPYILAAKEKNGTKVSYVLDVTNADPAKPDHGKRVGRFAGEEMVPASGSQDPWAAITPAVAQAIAAKATGSFAAWLPSAQAAPAATATAPVGVGVPKQEVAAAEPQPKTARAPPAKRTVAASPPASQTTGSIDRDGSVAALVPAVTGAPGDGSTSLTAAIQRELQLKGVSLADRATPTTYRVEGGVTLGQAREGKQAIQIEWVVKDPQGKRLGTVSQKNDIPEGSLDGAWGKTADQAATAAVQGIFKLLPPGGKATN